MHEEILGQRADDSSETEWLIRTRTILRPKAKRAFDFVSCVILFVIIFPVFMMIVLALVLTGQAPFYSHVRIGRGGREFGCLKFTSMRRNADAELARLLSRDPVARLEWETSRKLRKDPRVTPVGRFLRASSLDELPQLINICRGEMSLVGPRPVTRDEFTKFYGSAEAAAYVSVRPGLTGLWQVSGRSATSYAARVALDASYVKNLSLRTDLMILFQTFVAVLLRKGAW